MKYILVIDDDSATVGMAQITFQMSGLEAIAVTDDHKVSSALRSRQPDLILMAGHIGSVNGCSICQLLKNSTQFKHIPVMIISKNPVSDEDLQACGADDFMLKPFSMTELVNKTARLLNVLPQVA